MIRRSVFGAVIRHHERKRLVGVREHAIDRFQYDLPPVVGDDADAKTDGHGAPDRLSPGDAEVVDSEAAKSHQP